MSKYSIATEINALKTDPKYRRLAIQLTAVGAAIGTAAGVAAVVIMNKNVDTDEN